MTTTETDTHVEELRAAAKRIREAAEGTTSTEGDWDGFVADTRPAQRAAIFGGPLYDAGYRTGIVFQFREDCGRCDRPSAADVAWMRSIHPGLAEPLAEWLKSAAELARTHKTDPAYDTGHGFRWCLECGNEECEVLQHVDKALAVARAINGVSTGTKAVA